MLTNRTPGTRNDTRPRLNSATPWPDSLEGVRLDLAIANGRLRGLAVALEGRGDRGGAVAAEHIGELVLTIRDRLLWIEP